MTKSTIGPLDITFTATLGRVRDLDVLLQWVNSHSPAAERDSMLLEKRARAWRATRAHLILLSRRRWSSIEEWDSLAGRRGKLSKKFRKECSKIRAGLQVDEIETFGFDKD